MKYTQPDLPYANNALEPAISKQTVEFHYGKHEKAYIDNLNNLIEGTEFADLPLEEVIRDAKGALFNNASQAWNHIFYFFSFNPKPSCHEPTGELRRAIDRDFGSFEKFKEAFVEAGTGLFGSGWVWLSRDENGRLFLTQGKNAESPLTSGLVPLLTFDVWEHAYYLDYQNRRKDALERLWDIIDWPIVQGRY
ncbi:MAG TPA: superoxide dismutase [Porphyromonadaceae bacterium]|nr:superoxide dismutase [Porphyromonadaceae bacterium]